MDLGVEELVLSRPGSSLHLGGAMCQGDDARKLLNMLGGAGAIAKSVSTAVVLKNGSRSAKIF
jgi:hypothetical protein